MEEKERNEQQQQEQEFEELKQEDKKQETETKPIDTQPDPEKKSFLERIKDAFKNIGHTIKEIFSNAADRIGLAFDRLTLGEKLFGEIMTASIAQQSQENPENEIDKDAGKAIKSPVYYFKEITKLNEKYLDKPLEEMSQEDKVRYTEEIRKMAKEVNALKEIKGADQKKYRDIYKILNSMYRNATGMKLNKIDLGLDKSPASYQLEINEMIKKTPELNVEIPDGTVIPMNSNETINMQAEILKMAKEVLPLAQKEGLEQKEFEKIFNKLSDMHKRVTGMALDNDNLELMSFQNRRNKIMSELPLASKDLIQLSHMPKEQSDKFLALAKEVLTASEKDGPYKEKYQKLFEDIASTYEIGTGKKLTRENINKIDEKEIISGSPEYYKARLDAAIITAPDGIVSLADEATKANIREEIWQIAKEILPLKNIDSPDKEKFEELFGILNENYFEASGGELKEEDVQKDIDAMEREQEQEQEQQEQEFEEFEEFEQEEEIDQEFEEEYEEYSEPEFEEKPYESNPIIYSTLEGYEKPISAKTANFITTLLATEAFSRDPSKYPEFKEDMVNKCHAILDAMGDYRGAENENVYASQFMLVNDVLTECGAGYTNEQEYFNELDGKNLDDMEIDNDLSDEDIILTPEDIENYSYEDDFSFVDDILGDEEKDNRHKGKGHKNRGDDWGDR